MGLSLWRSCDKVLTPMARLEQYGGTPVGASPSRLDTALGGAAILLWSTTVAVGRSLTEKLGPLTAPAAIFLLGGGIGIVLRRLAGRQRAAPPRPAVDPRYLWGCGALFAGYQACLYLALGLAQDRAQVLGVALANYLWPMLTLLLSVSLLRLRARPWLVPGALLATAGVALAVTEGAPLTWASLRSSLATSGLPYALGAGAAVLWALYSVLARAWASDRDAVPAFMVATAAVLGAGRFLTGEASRWTGRGIAELGFMALGSSLAYMFWDRAVRKGDIVLVAAASYLTPLLSSAISALYLGVAPGPRLWLGGVLVVVGAAVCRLSVGAN